MDCYLHLSDCTANSASLWQRPFRESVYFHYSDCLCQIGDSISYQIHESTESSLCLLYRTSVSGLH